MGRKTFADQGPHANQFTIVDVMIVTGIAAMSLAPLNFVDVKVESYNGLLEFVLLVGCFIMVNTSILGLPIISLVTRAAPVARDDSRRWRLMGSPKAF